MANECIETAVVGSDRQPRHEPSPELAQARACRAGARPGRRAQAQRTMGIAVLPSAELEHAPATPCVQGGGSGRVCAARRGVSLPQGLRAVVRRATSVGHRCHETAPQAELACQSIASKRVCIVPSGDIGGSSWRRRVRVSSGVVRMSDVGPRVQRDGSGHADDGRSRDRRFCHCRPHAVWTCSYCSCAGFIAAPSALASVAASTGLRRSATRCCAAASAMARPVSAVTITIGMSR